MSQNVDRERRVPLFAAFVHDQASPGLDRVAENTWGWSRLGDSWRTTRGAQLCASPSGETCRETSVTDRSFLGGTFSRDVAVNSRQFELDTTSRERDVFPPAVPILCFIGSRHGVSHRWKCVVRPEFRDSVCFYLRHERRSIYGRGIYPIDPRYLSITRFLPGHSRVVHLELEPLGCRLVVARSSSTMLLDCVLVILLRVNCFLGLSSLLISWKTNQLRSGVYTESGIYSFRWGIYFLYISSSMTLDNCDYRCCSCFHWIKRNELNYGRLI